MKNAFTGVEVFRYNPETDKEPWWRSYRLPRENYTVLGALQYIQEHLDPTLAFRYSCRYGRCGLCAVLVNNNPALACQTNLQDGMKIAPLAKLPVLKDLVIERRKILEALQKHALYPEMGREECKGLQEPLHEPEEAALLRGCLECFSCLSSCPRYDFPGKGFAGPYFFVRLAQLHLDPRDRQDRFLQGREMGIEQCRECAKKCRCPAGIGIFENAIKLFLQHDNERL